MMFLVRSKNRNIVKSKNLQLIIFFLSQFPRKIELQTGFKPSNQYQVSQLNDFLKILFNPYTKTVKCKTIKAGSKARYYN